MTVSELIKELQKLNPDMEIWANSSVAGECFPITGNPFYHRSISCYQTVYGNNIPSAMWLPSEDIEPKDRSITKEVLLYEAE